MNQFKSANQILADAFTQATSQQEPVKEVQSSQEPEKKVEQPETTSKAEVKSETQEPAKPVVESEEFNFDLDDDAPVVKTETVQPTTFDFKNYVKDLGFEDINSEDEFKTRVKELKSKPSELEGVPDNLKKAIELSKKGADYLSYLKISNVDYSSIAPEVIFEHYIKSKLSAEEAADKLATISPIDKKLEGLKLREQYISLQRSQEAEIERSAVQAQREAAERKEKADQKLKHVLDNVSEIAGLKLKPGQKQDIYEAITTGRMQRELFFDSKSGEYDYGSMIETYFVKKNLPKIISKIEQVTKSKTIKNTLKDIQNVQIEKPQGKPEVDKNEKPALVQYIEELESKWKRPGR